MAIRIGELESLRSAEKPPDLLDALKSSYNKVLRQLEAILADTTFENAATALTGDGSIDSIESCLDLLKELAAYTLNERHTEDTQLVANLAMDFHSWCAIIGKISKDDGGND